MSFVSIDGSAHDDIANQNFDYRNACRLRDCLMTARACALLVKAKRGATPAK